MLLLDVSKTCHTHAQTGVQRVCRGIYWALKRSNIPFKAICYDPFLKQWRELFQDEIKTLERKHAFSGKWKRRGAHWAFRQIMRSIVISWLPKSLQTSCLSKLDQATGLIVPEIFSVKQSNAYSAFKDTPRVAVFHDATATTLPRHTASESIRAFDAYVDALTSHFEGIAANSSHSKETLLDLLKEKKALKSTPRIQAIELGVDPVKGVKTCKALENKDSPKVRKILSVGTLEGRKNHQALIQASKELWDEGESFELILAGGFNKKTGTQVLQLIEETKASGYSINYLGPVDEDTLNTLYLKAYFTVYPSIYEGFGLPIIESIQHQKPCITGNGGALASTAKGGGVMALSSV
ncbi:MAG TPA: hypothetical protein DIU37_03210, partial [Opitutae bacterium]|nr:hypothetical protein [Opitutae bacterium]